MNKTGLDAVLRKRLTGKVLAVGVGNRRRRDDGLGVSLVERLVPAKSFRPLFAGTSPEFRLSEIVREAPDVVMFVDAVDLRREPGAVAIVERGELPAGWGSTHAPPLSLVMEYVSRETGADTFLLGIQAEDVSRGDALSSGGARTVETMSRLINDIVKKNERNDSGEEA